MCGIIGYSGSFEYRKLKYANMMQNHRGPDDIGIYCDNAHMIGLGHTRLSIIDISTSGHQPMVDINNSVVLVFNGEIYNYLELKKELGGDGIEFRGNSDTEVLLNMYLTYGSSMLSKLNGIFAFAIWDSRIKTLFVARDALGIKPLYYASTSQGFIFASEIKSLICLVPQLNELDFSSLHRYISFLWCPGEGTPLKSVKKLLPGEALIVRSHQIVERWKWYDLPVRKERGSNVREGQLISDTTELLRQAVRRQIVADVPVGAFLSGGLDSSAVVALAKEQVPDIRCFTIDSGHHVSEGVANDLPYALKVAKILNVPIDVVKVDSQNLAADVERMIAQLDEPLADPAALNVLYICQLARKKGYKVLLSGVGGDDLFSGYRRHMAVRYEKYWRWLPPYILRKIKCGLEKMDQRRPFTRRLTKLSSGFDLDQSERIVDYFVWAKESQLLPLYSTWFREELRNSKPARPMIEYLRKLTPGLSALEQMLVLDQRFFLADHNLIYTDKMSMAASVEVRVPLLDMDLVEYAANIPDKYKQRGSIGKWIFKKAMESYLPLDVVYRTKTGFGVPLRHWMRTDLREQVHDLLSVQSLSKRGLFDPYAVQELIKKNDSGSIDASYTLFSLMSIEMWCRAFLDKMNNNIVK